MCESDAYLKEADGTEKLLARDVALVEDLDGKIQMTDILGEKKNLKGEIEEINFLEHKIVIRP